MLSDILVFAAHPDDAELACSGTVASMVANGKKVVIVDLTEGEMGTRGTPASRRLDEILHCTNWQPLTTNYPQPHFALITNLKLLSDILVFAAHPDDAELACSGTIASMVAKGKKVVIVDLTEGEMGTRGNTCVPEA